MLYSQMSPEQRQALLDNPENYPLHVRFLGKVGIVDYEQVKFLRVNGVDFDVDDRQAAEVLGDAPVREAAAGRAAQVSLLDAVLLVGAAGMAATSSLIRRILRRQ